jgi:hypothetical protein
VVEAMHRADGTGLALVFCETQEELRSVDSALDEMSPSADAGRRVSVGMYEVMTDVDLRSS